MASLMHIREPKNAVTNRRRVIITKRYNVIGSEELRAHPRVRKYWELPRDYCLIEIRDWVAQPLDSATSHEVAVARMDEAAIFAPFYHSIKSIAEIMTLHVPLPTTVYHLVTDRKSVSRWPQFCFSKEWETSSILHTACRLNSNSGEELAVTQVSITEWATAMIQAGVLRVAVFDGRLKNLDPLPGDLCATEPPNQLLALARKHRSDHHLNPAHTAFHHIHLSSSITTRDHARQLHNLAGSISVI